MGVPLTINNAQRKDPSGSLTREKFLLPETRLVAGLRLEGRSNEEIVQLAYDQNLFQFPSDRMRKDIARVCLRRLDSLGSERLTCVLANGMPDQCRQANVYVMMRHYDLVRSLMVDEIGRRYQALDLAFSRVDLNAFMTNYQAEHEAAQGWAESTCGRIKGTLAAVLHEGGYISKPLRTNVPCAINRILLDPEVEAGIRQNHDEAMLVAFDCLGE